MNRLPAATRAKIIHLLVEGNSIRGTARIMDVSKNTVTKLLVETGQACQWYQDKVFRDLNCKRMEVDEIWSFCYARERNVPPEHKGELGYGDVWTWTALDPDTRLVPCWLVADRSAKSARAFIDDLASRMKNRIQLTSDGYRGYLEAVEMTFGADVDYAMLVKLYGDSPEQKERAITNVMVQNIRGKPEEKLISTSLVERQNLTMRTNIKRFTRKTNAHSKKVENHSHAVALHFMFYHFARIHSSIKVTPAMAAGVTDRLWSVEDIISMVDGF